MPMSVLFRPIKPGVSSIRIACAVALIATAGVAGAPAHAATIFDAGALSLTSGGLGGQNFCNDGICFSTTDSRLAITSFGSFRYLGSGDFGGSFTVTPEDPNLTLSIGEIEFAHAVPGSIVSFDFALAGGGNVTRDFEVDPITPTTVNSTDLGIAGVEVSSIFVDANLTSAFPGIIRMTGSFVADSMPAVSAPATLPLMAGVLGIGAFVARRRSKA